MPRTRLPLRALAAIGLVWVPVALGCDPQEPSDSECPRLPAVTVDGEPRLTAERVVADGATATAPSQRYVLTSDSAFRRGDTALIRLCGVNLVLFDSLGEETARIRSDRGEYDPGAELFVARERVVVDAEGRRRLVTEELHYSPQEDRVWSPVRTRFQRPGVELDADSFVSDSRFQRIQAFRARGVLLWEPPP
jgi:LPS export ABC transporter protein LptC